MSELLTAFKTAFNIIPDFDWLQLDFCITFTAKGPVLTLGAIRQLQCNKIY
jgi:hypothetical protein